MRRLAALLLVATVGLGLAGCAPASTVAVSSSTIVIDVRTPDEYAAGHLDGARNIDLQSGSFESEISSLPLDGQYLVYCQSGNRAGQAVSIMESLGFTDVSNIGGISDAAASTGIAVVTG